MQDWADKLVKAHADSGKDRPDCFDYEIFSTVKWAGLGGQAIAVNYLVAAFEKLYPGGSKAFFELCHMLKFPGSVVEHVVLNAMLNHADQAHIVLHDRYGRGMSTYFGEVVRTTPTRELTRHVRSKGGAERVQQAAPSDAALE